jgi:hypothetical protein
MSTILPSALSQVAADGLQASAAATGGEASGQGCACDACLSDCPNARGFLRAADVPLSSSIVEAGR